MQARCCSPKDGIFGGRSSAPWFLLQPFGPCPAPHGAVPSCCWGEHVQCPSTIPPPCSLFTSLKNDYFFFLLCISVNKRPVASHSLSLCFFLSLPTGWGSFVGKKTASKAISSARCFFICACKLKMSCWDCPKPRARCRALLLGEAFCATRHRPQVGGTHSSPRLP